MQAVAFRAPISQARPVGARPAQRSAAARNVRMFSAPKKEAIEAAIKEAEETCADGVSGEW
jgi:hypothetical protein